MNIQEIEAAVAELDPSQLAQFGQWFDDYRADEWDKQIERDVKAGQLDALTEIITDEMLEHYALVAPWDEMADRLLDRYSGTASRVVMYLGARELAAGAAAAGRWGEIARAVRAG